MRGAQNHVYESQTASSCDPHSPGGLVGWTRAFCTPPREKMALGKANCPQPITIQLPPPAGSKPAQMRAIWTIFASRTIQPYPSISPGAYGPSASKKIFGYEKYLHGYVLDTKNYPKKSILVHLDTLAYLKIWEDIFVSRSRFEIPLSIPFNNYAQIRSYLTIS